MNPLTLHFVGGAAFFTGATALMLGMTGAWARRRRVRVFAWIIAFIGVLLIACSATPLPWWSYAVWASIVLAAMLSNGARVPRRARLIICIAAIATHLSVVLAEGRHHLRPVVPPAGARMLYVIGDSLSAGIANEGALLWPAVLMSEYGVDVANLSRGGATVGSALRFLDDQASLGDGLVLLEIGGNDQFGHTPMPEFEANLSRLIHRVSGRGRVVVMFELPLLPLNNAYGRVQRRLASSNGVTLIPNAIWRASSHPAARRPMEFTSPAPGTGPWPRRFGGSLNRHCLPDDIIVAMIPAVRELPATKRVRWTVQDYFRMSEAGVLDDRRVELLDGEIIEVLATSPSASFRHHQGCSSFVSAFSEYLALGSRGRHIHTIQAQCPRPGLPRIRRAGRHTRSATSAAIPRY